MFRKCKINLHPRAGNYNFYVSLHKNIAGKNITSVMQALVTVKSLIDVNTVEAA